MNHLSGAILKIRSKRREVCVWYVCGVCVVCVWCAWCVRDVCVMCVCVCVVCVVLWSSVVVPSVIWMRQSPPAAAAVGSRPPPGCDVYRPGQVGVAAGQTWCRSERRARSPGEWSGCCVGWWEFQEAQVWKAVPFARNWSFLGSLSSPLWGLQSWAVTFSSLSHTCCQPRFQSLGDSLRGSRDGGGRLWLRLSLGPAHRRCVLLGESSRAGRTSSLLLAVGCLGSRWSKQADCAPVVFCL